MSGVAHSVTGRDPQHTQCGLSAAREASCIAAFRAIMLAHHHLHARGTRVAARFGLHIAELNVIDMLGKLGSVSMGELSAATFISTSNTTHTVKKLESRGLVRRRRGARSQRVVEVSLTVRGRALFSRCYPGIVSAIEGQLAGLNLEQRKILVGLLDTLGAGASVDSRRNDPPPGTPG